MRFCHTAHITQLTLLSHSSHNTDAVKWSLFPSFNSVMKVYVAVCFSKEIWQLQLKLDEEWNICNQRRIPFVINNKTGAVIYVMNLKVISRSMPHIQYIYWSTSAIVSYVISDKTKLFRRNWMRGFTVICAFWKSPQNPGDSLGSAVFNCCYLNKDFGWSSIVTKNFTSFMTVLVISSLRTGIHIVILTPQDWKVYYAATGLLKY